MAGLITTYKKAQGFARKHIVCCKQKLGLKTPRDADCERSQPRRFRDLLKKWRKQNGSATQPVSCKDCGATQRAASERCDDNKMYHEVTEPAPLQVPPEPASALKESLLAIRKAEGIEKALQARIDSVEKYIEQLNRSIFGLDFELASHRINGVVSDPKQASKSRRKLEVMREGRDKLQERQEELEEELAGVGDDKAMDQARLGSALDELFVSNNLLLPQPQDDATCATNAQPQTKPCSRVHEPSGEGTCDNEQNSTHESAHQRLAFALQRNVGSRDLNAMVGKPQSTAPKLDAGTIHVVDPKEEAKRKYHTRKLFLTQAIVDFENRHEQFDEQDDKFMRTHRETATWDSESRVKLDHKQFLETQELTRAVVESEEDLYAAKEAAVAAGVDLGPDAESGFVDDPDDDPVLSQENDMLIAVDSVRIQRWLDNISNAERDSNDESPFVSEVPISGSWPIDTEPEVEVDEWESRSIEICDSLSMRAEGPWRRRIDKWRGMSTGMLGMSPCRGC